MCSLLSFQDESKACISSLLFFMTARDWEKESGDKDDSIITE